MMKHGRLAPVTLAAALKPPLMDFEHDICSAPVGESHIASVVEYGFAADGSPNDVPEDMVQLLDEQIWDQPSKTTGTCTCVCMICNATRHMLLHCLSAASSLAPLLAGMCAITNAGWTCWRF